MDELSAKDFTTIHGGYDRQFVMENPNLVVPLDVLREMEKAGEFWRTFIIHSLLQQVQEHQLVLQQNSVLK